MGIVIALLKGYVFLHKKNLLYEMDTSQFTKNSTSFRWSINIILSGQYIICGVAVFDCVILLCTVMSSLVDIISRCGHQQHDIILINHGGEGG